MHTLTILPRESYLRHRWNKDGKCELCGFDGASFMLWMQSDEAKVYPEARFPKCKGKNMNAEQYRNPGLLIHCAEQAARAVVERETPSGQPINQTEVLRHRVKALEQTISQLTNAIRELTAPRGGFTTEFNGVKLRIISNAESYDVYAADPAQPIDGVLSTRAEDAVISAVGQYTQIEREEAQIERNVNV